MDDKQRVVIIETQTMDNGTAIVSPVPMQRYQLGNHLGSASQELDEAGALISYEEYNPYGTSTFQAGITAAEVGRKRYRYTGKERDGESGFYYHGSRYYSAWTARWSAPDPAWISAAPGTNSPTISGYIYAACNPQRYTDPTGLFEEPVHGALTYKLALAAGFTEADAAHLALATAGVDHDPATAPVGGFVGTLTNAAKKVTANYHFPSFEVAEQRVLVELRKGKDINLNDLGLALHSLEDVGYRDAPGPHLRRTSEPTQIVIMRAITFHFQVGPVTYSEPFLPEISFTVPNAARILLGTPDSEQQNVGISHPAYTTETGAESRGWNDIADEAYRDPKANTTELTRIFNLLKDAATAFYGNDAQTRQNNTAAADAIKAVTSADIEVKVKDFLNQEPTIGGTKAHSYAYWVANNTFTSVKWSPADIDNSIVEPPPPPKYIHYPDGTTLDTQTGKLQWGPGPKW
jgi:RHS repeat-associated protein